MKGDPGKGAAERLREVVRREESGRWGGRIEKDDVVAREGVRVSLVSFEWAVGGRLLLLLLLEEDEEIDEVVAGVIFLVCLLTPPPPAPPSPFLLAPLILIPPKFDVASPCSVAILFGGVDPVRAREGAEQAKCRARSERGNLPPVRSRDIIVFRMEGREG